MDADKAKLSLQNDELDDEDEDDLSEDEEEREMENEEEWDGREFVSDVSDDEFGDLSDLEDMDRVQVSASLRGTLCC